ncbi:hypothetical protein [Streptomyces sp. NPDC020917]|uniref:hypothetical protein n=1 Tax=Streptomyces sp. NPDC020917 TaxID=3365102 RepID=UPI003794D6FC
MTELPTEPSSGQEVHPLNSGLRLLPWTSPEGKPAFLSGDGGPVSQMADAIESIQLDMAQQLLDVVPGVLDNPGSGPEELRYTGRRLTEYLTLTLRVAVSRGQRVTAAEPEEPAQSAQPGNVP